ncbi:glutaredoxin 3 [uncultured Litoreibacter sp.]|uniref:glutaredoxin 3 n=1 Tax=uncultured Litoreibacter sp. TaxID=1392394 RepID=UPI002606DC96|nr:glutaredoxin 3 [uncultured Litoreibacter sp.]
MAKIELYTKSTCGYCHAAKRLLAQKGVSYEETDVERDSGAKATMIQRSNGGRTVPQIFIDGKHIGGFDDLNALDRRGKLNALLK